MSKSPFPLDGGRSGPVLSIAEGMGVKSPFRKGGFLPGNKCRVLRSLPKALSVANGLLMVHQVSSLIPSDRPGMGTFKIFVPFIRAGWDRYGKLQIGLSKSHLT
jgi:hypothetical protein